MSNDADEGKPLVIPYGGYKRVEVLESAPVSYLAGKLDEALDHLHYAYQEVSKNFAIDAGAADRIPNSAWWVQSEVRHSFRKVLISYLVMHGLEPRDQLDFIERLLKMSHTESKIGSTSCLPRVCKTGSWLSDGKMQLYSSRRRGLRPGRGS